MVRGKNARWGHCSSDHGRAQHDGDGSKPQETGARWERTEGGEDRWGHSFSDLREDLRDYHRFSTFSQSAGEG